MKFITVHGNGYKRCINVEAIAAVNCRIDSPDGCYIYLMLCDEGWQKCDESLEVVLDKIEEASK